MVFETYLKNWVPSFKTNLQLNKRALTFFLTNGSRVNPMNSFHIFFRFLNLEFKSVAAQF